MKRVYFVRHGQTLKNTQHIHQGPEEPLTEVGRQQASEVARRLATLGVTDLLTSPYVRALETASIISSSIGIPLMIDESLVEFRRPCSLYGQRHYGWASLWYVWRLFWYRTDPMWNDDGAENMYAVRNRIVDAKRVIAAAPGPVVVVVSHAIFIDMFVQAVCADRSLSLREFFSALWAAKKLPNTGVVTFDVDDTAPPETCAWWLVEAETSPTYVQYR